MSFVHTTWTLRSIILRHRSAIRDVAFVTTLIMLVAWAAYEYSFTGFIREDKVIDFEEMLALGALICISVFYLGWRRIVEQEREIKRRITAERRAHEIAHTDPLTGLANRRQFESTLKAAICAPPGAEDVHAVLMLDLNGFKKVNDLYGHSEGDSLLVAIAQRLMPEIRDTDLIARLGGDEFAIVACHLAGSEGAANIAFRLVKALKAPIRIGARQHKISVGVGIALIPSDGNNADEILRKADIALYRAKNELESAVCFFEADMDRRVCERDAMELDLAAAIGTKTLRPWYQPIIDLKTGEVVAFEALARWSHPVLGNVSPDRFIPIAENCGLISDFTDWMLLCAARDALKWPSHVMLSVNISPSQLKDRTLGLRILRILGGTGLRPDRLELEITESAIVRDLEAAREVLSSLHGAGVKLALDDFGTGYSSLYHLRNFKVDKIKIDRSFVHTMGTEAESAAIVRALAGLGAGLGLIITAEGIESPEECEALLRHGCQQGQGFLFSRAVPAEETAHLFSRAYQTSALAPAA